MKFLVVLSALAAVAVANPGVASLGYNSVQGAFGHSGFGASAVPTGYSYSTVSVHAPAAVSAPAVFAAPAVHAPAVVAAPAVHAQAVVAGPAVHSQAVVGVKTQYQSHQGPHGQTSYGHSEPFQSHDASQDAHGNKVGSFSYVAPSGQVFRTDYVADALGYRVSSNALPVGPSHGPSETPEVAAARAEHLAHHQHYRAKRGVHAVGYTPAATAPLGAGFPTPVVYFAPVVVQSAPVSYSAVVAPHSYSVSHYSYAH
ncbi:cutile protein, putative [Pediculus humanus corporis]|uniref:Cutile protein, putative n=1 Tax=Pediculus humanus subsp. corporis TaxID=121224 RepID=E0VAC9_PEDHC|nr:cutile protein, putative [Pediculus humanus corporis]EEB10335.1 cutile protein, putative [Pediculus humanus corporis]